MKKTVIMLILSIMLVASVSAVNVGVLIDYSDGTFESECVSVSEGASAYDAVKMADDQSGDFAMTINGFDLPGVGSKHYIESINGRDASGSYYDDDGNYHAIGWTFWVSEGRNYVQPEFGPNNGMALDDYVIEESQLIILKHTTTVYSPGFEIIQHPQAPDYVDIGRACLKISEIDLEVDGESQKNMKNGERIKEDVKPGSFFEIELKARNLIDDEDDIQIEDVFIEIEIERIDDGHTFEKDSDETDINADDEEEIEMEFNLPIESDDRSYDMIVRIEGDGEDGITYYDEWTIPFSYDKDNHELLIERAFLTTKDVTCADKTYLDLLVYNIGDSNEDEVRIEVESDRFDFKYAESGIELDDDLTDRDSRINKRIPIDVPADIDPGEYTLRIRAYYDNGDLSDEDSVILTVRDCPAQSEQSVSAVSTREDESQVKEDVELNVLDEDLKPITGGAVDKAVGPEGFLEQNRFVIVVLAVILAVIVLAMLVVAAIKK